MNRRMSAVIATVLLLFAAPQSEAASCRSQRLTPHDAALVDAVNVETSVAVRETKRQCGDAFLEQFGDSYTVTTGKVTAREEMDRTARQNYLWTHVAKADRLADPPTICKAQSELLITSLDQLATKYIEADRARRDESTRLLRLADTLNGRSQRIARLALACLLPMHPTD